MDDQGHGTLTAGIAGAVGNNSIGVVGVNWGVKSCHARPSIPTPWAPARAR